MIQSTKRKINNLVVHCTATPQSSTIESIQRYWKAVKHWKFPGYHIIIPPNGSIIRLQPDHIPSNGVAKRNSDALHVSYIGGVDGKGKPLDNRTPEQKESLIQVLTAWMKENPGAKILGHRDFPGVAKACPSFNAREEYKGIK